MQLLQRSRKNVPALDSSLQKNLKNNIIKLNVNHIDLVQLARAVYEDENWAFRLYKDQSSQPPTGWHKVNRHFLCKLDLELNDTLSGFKSMLYTNDKGDYVYALSGTDIQSLKDWKNNVQQAFGEDSRQYDLAYENGNKLVHALNKNKLTFTGHSLGGGLASCIGALFKIPTITFNASGVTIKTLEKYNDKTNTTDDILYDSKQFITAYYLEGEALTYLQKNSKQLIPQAIGYSSPLRTYFSTVDNTIIDPQYNTFNHFPAFLLNRSFMNLVSKLERNRHISKPGFLYSVYLHGDIELIKERLREKGY